jgi:cytochrome P450
MVSTAERRGRPPTPPGHWLLGNLSEVRRDMPQALLDVTAAHGGLTRLRMGPASIYLVADPDLLLEVLVRRPEEFRKSDRTQSSIGWHLGRGLITLEGAAHRRHRRLMQPVMHTQRIAAQSDVIVDLARRRAEAWPVGSTQDVLTEMADLTLRIVSAALFSLDATGGRAEDENVIAAVHEFAATLGWAVRRAFPLPRWLPTAANRRARASIARLDTLVFSMIEERRRDGADRSDLLSMLVGAVDADGGPGLSDVEIRDELMTVFYAGHETSAAVLTWALYLLDAHPAVARALRSELATALDGRPVTVADLPRLPLLGAVVKETLRLYPPAWLFDRSPLADVELGGFALPKGSTLLLSPYVVHHDPRWWEAPAEFRPERFADGGEAALAERGRFLPFGEGPRLCIGNRFAESEIALVLATMLPMVSLSRVGDGPVRPYGDATLRPAEPIRMRVAHPVP